MTSESCFNICGIIIQCDATIRITLDYPFGKPLSISQELFLTRFPNANHDSPRGYASGLLYRSFLEWFCEMLLDSLKQSIDVLAYIFCVEFSNDLFERRFAVAAVTGYLSGCGRFE